MKDGDGFLCVYDVSDRLSFQVVKEHWGRLHSELDSKPPMVTVGIKYDIGNHEVSEYEGRKLALSFHSTFKEVLVEPEFDFETLFFEIVRQMRSHGRGRFMRKPSAEVGCCLMM